MAPGENEFDTPDLEPLSVSYDITWFLFCERRSTGKSNSNQPAASMQEVCRVEGSILLLLL